MTARKELKLGFSLPENKMLQIVAQRQKAIPLRLSPRFEALMRAKQNEIMTKKGFKPSLPQVGDIFVNEYMMLIQERRRKNLSDTIL